MTAIADLSAIINRLSGGNSGAPEHLLHFQDARVGAAAAVTVAGRWSSLWLYNSQPSAGAIPGAAAIPTRDTTGALKQINPSGGREKWLLGHEVGCSVAGVLVLYDRLFHIGGLSGTAITPQGVQTAGLPALTRNTGGIGNEIWIEIYTAIGTAQTITATYVNEAGTLNRTTPAAAIGGAGLQEAQRMIPLPLAAGDQGVRSVDSVTLSASTGTAGNFGVTIARPLLALPVPATGMGYLRDTIAGLPSIPKIDTDACLALAWLANSTTGPQIHGLLHFIDN